MTSPPQNQKQPLRSEEVAPGLHGDGIVISGMSGLFPKSGSVEEFSKILYDKVNPVTSTEDSRWKWQHPEISNHIGKVPDLDRFDSKFFMVHHHLCSAMDPMARKVLEQSFQAIYDAGLCPKHLNGKKVGVFIAASLSETEKSGTIDISTGTGYGITGCSKTMFANRISYWLNAKGPSMTIDDACCGSMTALEEACSAINSGVCEAAIVGGASLCLLPHAQVHYKRCIDISTDGKTRSFDENASGCSKSEAICVLFLQKAKNAMRAYAEVIHVKNEFISKLRGETGQVMGFVRDPDTTATFLKQFYSETNIPTQAVKYIEAFGSATPEADKAELQAIEKVFCGNRTDPLLIGSVISNIGFTEAATGAVAITKVLLGYHRGLMASNLHCVTPRQDVAAIRDGRMRVLTEHQPFHEAYAAVNCLSVTGVNSHVLLRGCAKSKDSTRYQTSIPRLVTLSARQEEYLQDIFLNLKSRAIDPEELALLQNIHCNNISGHLGRGYIILDTDEQQNTISVSEKAVHSDETQRPLWFVYSGMGSQWAGMGTQLMRIPIFAAAIERCRKVLEPKGIDIVHIVTSPDKTIFDNVLNSFVGIAAIQIGLTDILTALGLYPDKIIGHSVGELGCAYADGCLSAEEMIMSAYSRGQASNETPLERGAMAAVGLGYKSLSKLCPAAIDIACHNGPDSCTISGPEKNVREFVSLLTAKGVFAKEVPSGNIAYHSRYIADAGPSLLRLLSEIIREPRARSERWLSTSVPQEKWHEPAAKYSSAEYFTNNLLSSVYFEETSRLIPSNAVLVEIAPHGLLQAILKRSLPETCTNIPLTQRGHKDSVIFVLDAIGKLYVEGYTPQVHAIYPEVEFPVSTGTPHLAHFVKWYHTESWTVLAESVDSIRMASSCKLFITTHDDQYSFLKGNIIQGKVLYPFAAALVAVWDTLAMSLGKSKKNISVRFHDVHLYCQPILHDERQLELYVSVQRGSGQFQVLNGDSKIATGYVFVDYNSSQSEIETLSKNYIIDSEELYDHFNHRGYSYRGEFKMIHSVDESLSSAQIVWNDNWVTMVDGLLQLNVLKHSCEGVLQPTQIRELTIDVEKHLNSTQANPLTGETVVTAEINDDLDCTRCGGVVIHNIKFRNIPPSSQELFKLMTPTMSGDDIKKIENEKMSTENAAVKKPVALQITTVGDLDTLHWEEVPGFYRRGVNVRVEYAGINVSDVKRATGAIPNNDEKYYGMDFSGKTERGERVMGLVRNGAVSTVVSAWPDLLWPVPAHWTLEDAATVPLAYVQAYYYLCIKDELQAGWSVLVHGAAGALGQAAVSVALARGCRLFCTVADGAKKRFLLRLFPQLNEDSIGNSRDASFVDMVLHATNGDGCRVVISCLENNLKNYSLKCASFSGVTVDTAQIQNGDKYEYGMFNMTRERSYVAADIYSIFVSGNNTELKRLHTLVSEGIAVGHVRPLSRVTLAPHEAPRAFRLLAASRQRGRVLLRAGDRLPLVTPRIVCSPETNHLIVWDGSSFGLQLADRLISRGATKLRILCLNSTSQYLLKLRLWKTMGVKVDMFCENLTNSNAIYKILHETDQDAPIEGIYVIATVSDSKLQNVLARAVDHFDTISRKVCAQLRYFSVITTDCNIGQYTSSCLSRVKDGFPAKLLSLPGYTAENIELGAITEEAWNRAATNVTELALRLNNPVLVAQTQPVEKPSLSKLIAALADYGDEDTMIQNIGESLPVIKSFLRDLYHIALEDGDILKLTKKKILDIEMSLTNHNIEEIKGLDTFISYIDHDEIRANTDFMPLSTLVSDTKTMAGGVDDSKPHLFIIPGLEGQHARFRALSERLKLSAVVLQPGLDRPRETVPQLALRYSKILLDTFKLKTNFYLLGYEFGVVIALELASILEDRGLLGTVYCLGDGPEELKALLEAEMQMFDSEEVLQEGVAQHMSALMARSRVAAPDESALEGRVSHSAQYAHALVEAASARICTARCYNAAPRALRSRLVLLRARRVPDTGEECSLQRFSQRALVVADLAAPMSHAAGDLRVPAIINKYLDNDILKSYDNSNLCETYLIRK